MAQSEYERQDAVTRGILETMRQFKTDPTPLDIAMRVTAETLKERRDIHGKGK